MVLVVHRFSLQCMHVRRRSISKSTYYRMDHFRITSYSHFVVGVCPDLLFTCRTPQYSLTLNLAPLVGYYMCSRFDQKLIQPGQQQDRNQFYECYSQSPSSSVRVKHFSLVLQQPQLLSSRTIGLCVNDDA